VEDPSIANPELKNPPKEEDENTSWWLTASFRIAGAAIVYYSMVSDGVTSYRASALLKFLAAYVLVYHSSIRLRFFWKK
jgi:hypothetical protein